jgi:hypothetical protein
MTEQERNRYILALKASPRMTTLELDRYMWPRMSLVGKASCVVIWIARVATVALLVWCAYTFIMTLVRYS